MKAFIYCTQTKPYLISMGKDTKGVEMFQIIFDKKDWSKDEKYLNGSIVAECDVKEALILSPTYKDYSLNPNHCDFDDVSLVDELAKRMGFGKHDDNSDAHEFLDNYSQGKDLYAYHLEHVKPIELHLSDFYEDEDCTKPLTKAPKGYRYAYSIVECEKSEAHFISSRGDKVYYSKAIKCLIFSMHSETCINILSLKCDLIPLTIRIAEGVTFK